jgi:branched-chain amino acid transport system ATP-binding protein
MSAISLVPAGPDAVTPAHLLRVDGLTQRFGGLVAVSDLTFHIRPGEILGLIGPNGAGKTTTFNLLSGFLRPSAGALMFDGEDITGLPPYEISRRGIVRTFQHNSFFREMTVEENIAVALKRQQRGLDGKQSRVKELAHMVDLEAHLTVVAGSLPHGLQRLLSIAIAIAPKPRLLGLDEPLTGLHSVELTSVLGLFRRLRDEFDTTILLVDHNMKAMMELCDRFIVLQYGRLLAQGSAQEISSNPDVIGAYLGRPE